MPQRWQPDDDFDDDDRSFDDDLHDSEDPDEPNDDDDDDSVTIKCAACGAMAYEFSEHCPHCGEQLVHDTRAWSGRSWVWIALGLAGIIAVILAILNDHGVIRLHF